MAAKKKKAITAAPSARRLDFLARILADPKDVTARLVYADLLMDEGDPRGELISVQCARTNDPDNEELASREAAILKKHKKAWSSFVDAPGARWEYREGFVEKLSMDAAHLVAHGDAVFAAEPVLELAVWKIDESETKIATSSLAPVLALAGLARVRRLSLARSLLSTADVAALATATTLDAVEALDLTATQVGAEGALLLAKRRSMPRLRELRLGTCDLGDAGVRHLIESDHLLTSLVLSRNDIRAAGATLIANAPWSKTLTSLDVSTNDIYDEGMRALIGSENLFGLRSLKVEYCGLTDAIVDDMMSSIVIASLTHLDLSSNLSREAVDRLRSRYPDKQIEH